MPILCVKQCTPHSHLDSSCPGVIPTLTVSFLLVHLAQPDSYSAWPFIRILDVQEPPLVLLPPRGTATRLVAAALQWSHKKGCSTTVVNTETTNDAALGVYAAFGFAPMDEGLVVLECEL